MTAFGIVHYETFVLAIVLFQIAPGPGTLAILRATARGGVRGGMGAVLGTLAGDALYMLAAVFGVAAVLAANPRLFAALQWLGIGYLSWMGVRLVRESFAHASPVGAPQPTNAQHARQAFAVCLTNPKVILFFMAFFPQFMAPDASRPTLMAMMLHVTGISFLYQTTLVLTGNAVARRLARFPFARALASRLAGVALVGFGLRLAANRR